MLLTRRYRFSASHRLHVDALSETENSRLFGKCNNPYGHGHDYVLSVTVAGEADPKTGLIIVVSELDRMVETNVLQLVAHRNLNVDVPQFAGIVPTTENVGLMIAGQLASAWLQYFGSETRAQLWSVHLQETDRNGFEILMSELQRHLALARKQESVPVHA